MAFKRKFTRRFRTKSMKGALARKANWRFDNFLTFRADSCDPVQFPPNECPDESTIDPARIVLIDNSVLELQYNDSATVVAQAGKLHFIPFYVTTSADHDVNFLETLAGGYHFMGGTRVIEQGVGGTSSVSTDDPIANPIGFQDDFTDVKWLKFWERKKANIESSDQELVRQLPGAPFGLCADTSKPTDTAPANTLTNGSGTITISAISTTCTVSNFPGTTSDTLVPFQVNLNLRSPIRGFTLNFGSRRRIKLTGKQALVFDFSYAPVFVGVTPPPVGFAVYGSLKALVRV